MGVRRDAERNYILGAGIQRCSRELGILVLRGTNMSQVSISIV